MKKLSILAVFTIAILQFQCDQKQPVSDPNATQPDSTAKVVEADTMYPGPILYDHAATAHLASSFLQLGSSFGNLKLQEVMIGVFDAKHFSLQSGMAGVRLWYCYNPTGGQYPKFFLALEQIKSYNFSDPADDSEMNDTLYVPTLETYQGNSDINSLDAFVRSTALSRVQTKDIPISKQEVLDYAAKFKDLMKQISPEPLQIKHPYALYPLAYFNKNQDFDTFLAGNPDAVYYLMGYLPLKNYFPNYLRPVIGTIKRPVGTASMQSGGGDFLQASWPPPPVQ